MAAGRVWWGADGRSTSYVHVLAMCTVLAAPRAADEQSQLRVVTVTVAAAAPSSAGCRWWVGWALQCVGASDCSCRCQEILVAVATTCQRLVRCAGSRRVVASDAGREVHR